MRGLVVVLFVLLDVCSLFAQTMPTGFTRVQVGAAISNPTVMAFAPDGRIFVAQQTGELRVIKNDQLLPTPFISLPVNFQGERGLIGIAFDPNFTTNNFIYLYYTVNQAPIHNRISRFTANGDVVVAGSEQIVLELDALSAATNHNGGALAFGKDGYLYVAIGENANGAYAQNLDIYHGKFLRINKDGSAPPDNPLSATGTERSKRFWAWGLRNPYTFSIHPITGRIFINDVGQSTWEEVNDATTGGKNFGWPTTEGATTNPNFTTPIFSYPRSTPQPAGCALTGGTFFFPANTNYPPIYYGKYFIQDFCSNWIYYFDPGQANPTATQFATNIGGSSLSLMAGPDGNLYYLSRGNSRIYKILYTPPVGTPAITVHPQPVTVNAGQSATFSVTATGTAPLTYQWLRNAATLTGKTEATLTIPAAAIGDGGNYSVTVSNSISSVTSNQALLTVNPVNLPNNQAPTASIIKPADGATYAAGAAIAFEGTGTDPEDGTLAAASLSWAINFHHDTHKHDQPAISGIASGTFDVPNRGETSSNVWYRIILTVTDAGGLKAKDSVDVHPLTSKLSLASVPAGLQVTVDGQPVTTPVTITSVEGRQRDIGVTAEQKIGEETYLFAGWSQGGAATQTITTPADDATYTANFSLVTVGTPAITVHPQPVTVNAGQSATFSVTATGTAPLTYQWLRNATTLTGKTEATLTIPAAAVGDGGNYYVTVSNPLGSITSNQALLTVNPVNDPNNQAPTASITRPADGATYAAGTAIAFEGTGTDPEDGSLAAASLSWAINFHHDIHKHDQPAINGIASGSFDVPNRGETSSNVWYRFILTVTDAGGLKAKDSVDVHPLTSKLSFATVPAGLQVTVDGQPVTTPVTITSVEGLQRDIGVTPQVIGDDTFSFASWSQGGAATQTITTPADDATYTANFSVVTGVEHGEATVVYPNPAEGVIYIADAEVGPVGIINSVGKSTSLISIRSSDKVTVDVSHLAPGIYVLFYAGKKVKLILK